MSSDVKWHFEIPDPTGMIRELAKGEELQRLIANRLAIRWGELLDAEILRQRRGKAKRRPIGIFGKRK